MEKSVNILWHIVTVEMKVKKNSTANLPTIKKVVNVGPKY
jgi:hypothetical protein